MNFHEHFLEWHCTEKIVTTKSCLNSWLKVGYIDHWEIPNLSEITCVHLTNFMDLSATREATSCAATQELPSILLNQKVPYHINNITSTVPITSQTNPVHTTSSYPSKIHFNIIEPHTSTLSDSQHLWDCSTANSLFIICGPSPNKFTVFWDVTPCDSCKKRRFGGTLRLHHQGDKNRWTSNNVAVTSNWRMLQRTTNFLKFIH
jgi:hypothetical protein